MEDPSAEAVAQQRDADAVGHALSPPARTPGVDPTGSGGSAARASRLGHQIGRPTSYISAGTRNVRTTSVSSSTPNATANPISARNTSGSTPRTENVAASTTPAEVMTPPVTVSPRRMPRRVPLSQRLLAHAGHQEDVVVDAERDEEHEREQRERRVGAGEAEARG